ncbi:hypothetical protein NQ318_020376 [Aromia moschata]|uniref:CCHC-type domain-containing protein n=1 Tax=Aromia moschata TaxID=1265417 RepID=A0AAV8Y3Q5_9CUCU|nr:hypothetical protein NQ318_020376 [Aromia moschata]
MEIRETMKIDPMVYITGIDKGYEDEEFITELVLQNERYFEGMNIEDIKRKTKIISRRQCRNEQKENIILQTTPDIFRIIIKTEDLRFNVMKLYAEEYSQLAICFKCCGYGHVTKYCTVTKSTCYVCGGEHDESQCSGQEVECTNCKRLKLEPRKHSARDPNCPAYRRRLEVARRAPGREKINFISIYDEPGGRRNIRLGDKDEIAGLEGKRL